MSNMGADDINVRLNLIGDDSGAIASVEELNNRLSQTGDAAAAVAVRNSQLLKSFEALNPTKQYPEEIERALKRAAVAATATAEATGKVAKESAEVRRISGTLDSQLVGAWRDTRRETERAADAMRDYVAEAKQARFSRDNIGDLSTGLSSIGSVASLGGANPLSEVLMAGADVSGVAEYWSNLKESVRNAGLAASEGAGLVGALASNVSAAVPGLGAAASGFVAMGLAIAPVAAAAAAAGAAIAIVANRMNEVTEAGKEAADFILAGIDAQVLASQALRNQDAELLQQSMDNASAELEAAQLRRDAIQAEIDTLEARYATESGDAARGTAAAIAGLTEKLKEADTTVSDANSTFFEISEVYFSAAGQSLIAAQTAEDAAEATAEAEKKLAAEREKAAAEAERLAEQQARLVEQERRLLESYEQRTAQVALQRQLASEDAMQDAAIARARAQEELARQTEAQAEAHADNLAAITQAGADKILDIRQQLADKEAAAAEKIADLRADYDAQQAKELEDFNKQRLRDLEDYNRERLRLETDLGESLLDARLANDVTAAEKAKQQAAREISELDAGYTEEQQRIREDFEAEQQADAELLASKIQDINEELAVFRQQTAEKIALTSQQTDEQIASAIATHEERLRLDAEQRAEQQRREEEDSALRLARQQRDQALQDAAAADALAKALANIDTESAAKEAAYAEQLAAMETLEAAAYRVKAALQTGTTANPLTNLFGGIAAAANSVLYTPYKQSTGYPATGALLPPPSASRFNGTGAQNIFNIGVQVPSGGVSRQDIDDVINATEQGIRRAQDAVIGAVTIKVAQARGAGV